MNRRVERTVRWTAMVAGVGLLLAAGGCSKARQVSPANAAAKAEVWLCAKAGGITMPDGVSVTIWGYVLDSAGFGGGCAGEPTLPGPALTVGVDDPSLTIHLRNLLPEPTSIVVPGQTTAMTPVWSDGSTGPRTAATQRVRSFTKEAAPNGGEATYEWSAVRPGTFLYHSGTHPQVQVQMGLYGAVTRDFAGPPGNRKAYDGVSIDGDVVVLFSEIDPDQHLAIANGTYGTPPAPTSTLRYAPKYFLINGKPFDPANPTIGAVRKGKRTLLRFLNAGLQTYVPTIQGIHMKMIAEDGNPYPWGANPREQYSALLASLKTVDALVAPPVSGGPAVYPLYDRRLNLTTGLQPDGGMLAHLSVTP
jgi:FtsP/CotA-like multicopper oxidase with cupredoxin domain